MNIWQKVDRPWSDYPIGTKARQSWEAGCWIKNEHGWNWHTGATFPTPGGANQVMLAAAPTAPAPEVEPVAWLIEYDCVGVHRISLQGHNAIADYRDIDPEAKSTPLYPHPANDGLRKAAEELLAAWDDPQLVYLNPSIRSLRDALEKK